MHIVLRLSNMLSTVALGYGSKLQLVKHEHGCVRWKTWTSTADLLYCIVPIYRLSLCAARTNWRPVRCCGRNPGGRRPARTLLTLIGFPTMAARAATSSPRAQQYLLRCCSLTALDRWAVAVKRLQSRCRVAVVQHQRNFAAAARRLPAGCHRCRCRPAAAPHLNRLRVECEGGWPP